MATNARIDTDLDERAAGQAGAAGGRARTQFKPGNSGRPQGARNKRTRLVEDMIDGELEEMTRKIVSHAAHGNQKAIFYCLDRAAPASKEATIEIDLPTLDSRDDVVEASKRLMAALAEGEVGPVEAGRVMTLLERHLAIIDPLDGAEEEEEPDPEAHRRRIPVVFVD